MITTIQLREEVKRALDRLKENRETYEEVIVKLVDGMEKNKRNQEEMLIEGYKEMAEESLKMQKEWESTDNALDWEW